MSKKIDVIILIFFMLLSPNYSRQNDQIGQAWPLIIEHDEMSQMIAHLMSRFCFNIDLCHHHLNHVVRQSDIKKMKSKTRSANASVICIPGSLRARNSGDTGDGAKVPGFNILGVMCRGFNFPANTGSH